MAVKMCIRDRLRRIRLNDCDRDEISSLPGRTYSGTSGLPMLTSLAISAIRTTGRITTKCNRTLSRTSSNKNTPPSRIMKVVNVCWARARDVYKRQVLSK